MENSYKLKIETREFDINFSKYLDYCCKYVKPKRRMNREEHRRIKTEKTDGVFSVVDLFQMSACSIQPLREYLKDHYGVILLQDIGDIEPDEDMSGVLIAFNNEDGFSFVERQESFGSAFVSWVSYEYGNEDYRKQVDDEYEDYVKEACNQLNVSRADLEKALYELQSGVPENSLSETAKKLMNI